jgi:hypothetical protein
MIHIALIDDKEYGQGQIRSLHEGEEFTLTYFSTFAEFDRNPAIFDITYLDYYLDKDGITSDKILSQVKAKSKKVIAFSSVERCNKLLKELGADGMVEKF